MARSRRFALRLLVAAAAAGAGFFILASRVDRRAARDLLPPGAAIAFELRDGARVLGRIEGTRFAAAFAGSASRAWLEQTDAIRLLDDLRAEIGRTTGYTPTRWHLLDLVGAEAVAAWYPPALTPDDAPWIAAGRLSWRAWGLAAALRIAARIGLGAGQIVREPFAGRAVYALGSGGETVQFFLDGRLLVAGNNRDLVQRAAELASGAGTPLTAEAAWSEVRRRLPAGGELFLWVRGGTLPPDRIFSHPGFPRAAGALVSSGSLTQVTIFTPASLAPAPAPPSPETLPALSLLDRKPLLLFATGGQAPGFVVDLLARRVAEVAQSAPTSARPPLPALGRGFALAVTETDSGGLFPRPHGLLTVGMRGGAEARQALRLLFPPGARTADGAWGTALSTRESLPLAGEFELWGAAVGSRIVLATDSSLLGALEAGDPSAERDRALIPDPSRPPDSVTVVDVTKALPVLRRYAPPLSGLLHARFPAAPEITRDLDLLAAVRAVTVATGATAEGSFAWLTLGIGDLPAPAGPARLP